ncbi:class F sortase [Streptomyces sp. RFCAC02]|uniref:class F sortase n=1 Tax=Streptomyces sp. RFCAC02 TaxID=2499143 RepID=UPI00101F9D82|nr:class F sortase [Streptomyces sp. RFCAC02]
MQARRAPGRARQEGHTPARSEAAPREGTAEDGGDARETGRTRKAEKAEKAEAPKKATAAGQARATKKTGQAARPEAARSPAAAPARRPVTASPAAGPPDRRRERRRRRSGVVLINVMLLGTPAIGRRVVRRAGRLAVAIRLLRLVRALLRARRNRRRRARGGPPPARRTTRHQRLALRSRRWEALAAVTAVGLTVAVGLVGTGGGDDVREARASSQIADGVSRPGAVDAPGAAPDAGSTADLGALGSPSGFVAPPLPRSEPTRIRIPQLGTDVEVFGAALGTDGGPPSPAEEDAMRAAWYSGGVAPGERGASLIVGHLDTYTGPAAFAGLGQLRPGENIEIDREDGRTAVFTVDSVEQYPKSDFPDERVYGAVDTPQLRLITCGGRWSRDGGYDSNIVAYARLTGTLPPVGDPAQDPAVDPADAGWADQQGSAPVA